MPEKKPRLLFVDDEDNVRIMLGLVLEKNGFSVTSVGTVPEALSLIAQQEFDVLIADLNVGSPGDGFTVVSAMRRTRPKVVTFILTGYPAFDTALAAIRKQVEARVSGRPGFRVVSLNAAGGEVADLFTKDMVPGTAALLGLLLSSSCRMFETRQAPCSRSRRTADQLRGSDDVVRAHWCGCHEPIRHARSVLNMASAYSSVGCASVPQ